MNESEMNIMKKQQNSFTYRASVMAVRGALISLAMAPMAFAEDVTKADLTNPTSVVELGLTNVNSASQKFGEYNGLQDKAVTVDAAFDLRGGSAYDSNGVTRFRLSGKDLGVETRNLQAEFAEQGRFRINLGLDELRRNTGDGFQTPYEGVGSNMISLPRTWITPAQLNVNPNATVPVIPGVNARALDPNFIANDSVYRFNNAGNNTAVGAPSTLTAPLAAQTAAMLAASANDRALFHNENIYTTRKKTEAGFMYNIDTQWDVTAKVRREDKNGTMLRNALSRNTGGDISLTLPVAVDTTTDQFDLALNFRDANSHLGLAYYGSMFKDHNNDSMSWEAWQNGFAVGGSTPFNKNTTTTGTPTNQFHQFNATGGYNFSKDTKLAMNASYARNTQNTPFTEQEEAAWDTNPANSLNGKVITKSFNLKLTTKPVKDLNVSAMYKYNDRDNQTPVYLYGFDDAGDPANVTPSGFAGKLGSPAAGAGANFLNTNANRPYSKKTQDVNLEADYNLGNGQTIIGAYDHQKIERGCSGTWVQCSDAPNSRENRLRAEWRGTLTEDLNGRLGYTRSERKADYNELAWLALVPMASQISAAAAAGGVTQSLYQTMLATGLNGWGPNAGFPLTGAGVAMTTAQQQTAFGVNQAFYWLNNNVVAAQNGYGNVNVIYDPLGFRRFYAANRDQDRLRGALNWQATDQLSLAANLEYTKDKYPESVYGLTGERTQVLNLEAGYAANDNLNFGAYYTYDDRTQQSRSNARGANSTTASVGAATDTAIIPDGGCSANGVVSTTIALRNLNQEINTCGDWGYDRKDKTNTIGLNFKQNDLAGGKLDLKGDLSYAKSKSDNSTSSGTWVNNPAALANAPTVTAAFFVPATPMPTVSTDLFTLKLAGHYKLDKVSAVKVGYTYNRLKYTDWAYDDRSIIGGGLSGVLPSNETAPNYTVNTVSAAYVYSFK